MPSNAIACKDLRLAHVTDRDHDEMHRRLSWYEKVSKNLRPAKYRTARRIACDIDLEDASDEALWREHEHLSAKAREFLSETDSGKRDSSDLPIARTSYLDVKARLLSRMLRRCTFCEWKCKVDRIAATKKGACRLDSTSRVNTWFLHFGEEPPLVGHGGSGTIFFSSCTFRCVFLSLIHISEPTRPY